MTLIFPLRAVLLFVASLVLASAIPVDKNSNAEPTAAELNLDPTVDTDHALEYAALKHVIIYDWGYSREFAEMVEINLKRAIKEELERQRQLGLKTKLRQEPEPMQPSEEDDDEESTTMPGPTTPGPSPVDVVRGVAGILTSVGTLDVNNFWGSFVNFFPPIHREGAQALVDASQGRRPAKWPTLPTTTTKMTTTTKDPDDSGEEVTSPPAPATDAASTQAAATIAPASAPAPAPAVTATAATVAVTAVPTKAPTTKYTVRRRTGTILPGDNSKNNLNILRNSEPLLEESEVLSSTASTSTLAPETSSVS